MSQIKKSPKQQVQVKEKTQIIQKTLLAVGIFCAILVGFNFALIGFAGINKFINMDHQETDAGTAMVAGVARQTFSVPTEDTMWAMSVNKLFNQDENIQLAVKKEIIAFSVSGSAELNNRESYVRIILHDSQGNRYLVFNTDELIKDFNLNFSDICEETCYLDPINPVSLEIQINEAKLTINQVKYLTADKTLTKTKEQIKEEQHDAKITRLNQRIIEQGLRWQAGDTGVSRLSFIEKEKLLKGRVPNLCGFMYYKDGFFPFCESADSFKGGSTTLDFDPENPFIFDWRYRHLQWWLTASGEQLACGSCWAFGAVGAVESVIDLYYNQHLFSNNHYVSNNNLSVQDLISCSSIGNCGGGNPPAALNYIQNTGVVDEECFPYSATNESCENRCNDWEDRLWKITSYEPVFATEFDVKSALYEDGPISWTYYDWNHAMVLSGWGEIVPGTFWMSWYTTYEVIEEGDPLIGTTYWIAKNSWGPSWGASGYGQFIIPSESFASSHEFYSVGLPVIPPSSEPPHSISCVNNDNDDYCWWGLTPDKPADCPASCSGENEPDCNDAYDTIGACPENYICGSYESLPSGELEDFGDYFFIGQSSCCGDNPGEYQVENFCCKQPEYLISLQEQETYIYDFFLTFGSYGSGSGEFNNNWDVEIYNDQIYVVDRNNNRIQIFDLEGNFINSFGSFGAGGGEFFGLRGIAVYNDQIYVADTGNHRIQIFDLEGNFISMFGSYGSGSGQFKYPEGIASANDQIYVADTGNHRIQIFDLEGNFINTFGNIGSSNGEFNSPTGIDVDNMQIYVADTNNNRIQIFDLEGNFISLFGSTFFTPGSNYGQFKYPEGIAVYNEIIFVADTNNNRIQLFDLNGNVLSVIGSYGSEEGEFNLLRGLAVINDRIYIADTGNHRIQIFDLQSTPVCVFDPSAQRPIPDPEPISY